MLGFAALAEVALAEVPGLKAAVATKVVGRAADKPRRRIPIEDLRAILRAQGNRWADELGEVYAAVEERILKTKSKKHRKALEEAYAEVSVQINRPINVDWGLIISELYLAAEATRATAAIKHAERVLYLLRDNDDEEVILLLYG